MKLNRKWLMVIALVLSLTMATAGTMAYLTDKDADKNTMTLGKVEIVQNEHQRAKDENGDYKTDTIDDQTSYVLEVFENDKPLLPATEVDEDGNPVNNGAGDWDPEATVRMSQIGSYGGMTVFTSKNAQDKFVTVTNTGRTDAYVRTIIAFESGSITVENFDNVIGSSVRATSNQSEIGTKTPWSSNFIGSVNIDGNNYMVWEYVYAGAQLNDGSYRHAGGVLPAGDTTYPNLSQVYMNSTATNEDVEAIDGNGNGTYDIMVLSQAVQADGFDDAATALKAGFGEVNAANVQEWFGEMEIGSPGEKNETNDVPESNKITNVEELKAALKNGGEYVLANDITTEGGLQEMIAGVTLTLDMGNNTLTGAIHVPAGANLTVKNGSIKNTDSTKSAIQTEGTVELNNVNVTSARHGVRVEGGTTTINGGTYMIDPLTKSTLHAVNVSDGGKVIINDGTFVGPQGTDADSGAAVNIQANSTGIINDGNFSKGKNNTLSSDGTLTVYGGTFDQDPTAYVAAGCKVDGNATNGFTVTK